MAGARAGTPGLVLVGGEAGVGKSRLVAELTAYASADGDQILAGQCVGFDEATIPLLPVIDALRGLDDGAQDLLDTRLVPVSAAGPPAGLHPLVLDRLAAAAATAPILLIVEDVHWADRSTLELLAYLARRLGDERVLVVATYRSDEVDRHERLRRFLADVATAARAQRLALDRLSRAQTREQLAGILGEAPPEPLLDAVFARAEGNPFFAEELIAAAREGAEGLPPTLRDMLLARIHALDPRAQAVVRIAAAGGRDVHHQLLAAAAGLPEPDLSDTLRDAVRQHVLVAVGDGYAFRHALLQRGGLRRAAARRAGACARRLRRRAGGAARPRRRQHGDRHGRDRAPLAARRRRAARAGRGGTRGHRGRARRRARRGRGARPARPRAVGSCPRRRAARGHRSRGAARPRRGRGGLDGGCRRGHRACRCRDRAPRGGGRARARRGAPAAAGAVPVAARARARERARPRARRRAAPRRPAHGRARRGPRPRLA